MKRRRHKHTMPWEAMLGVTVLLASATGLFMLPIWWPMLIQ